MNTKKWLIAGALGFAIGYTIAQKNRELISPERALKRLKESAQKKFTVTGSWIHVKPESIERFKLPYTVYRGGISTLENNRLNQYEFLIDAKSGSILELSAIN
ncbi:PepSY domain-containing protein [Fictibacillus sp. Mic-4]|uniref:PepSY domain-containing protein n=1 Tax=Fictibacillus TaxID=1329200 RepID=UPI0004292802|nr:PepSY domain-containing protein [Fictibacillus gelatini]